MDSRNTIAVTENLSADLDYPNSIDLIIEDKRHDLCPTYEIVHAPSLGLPKGIARYNSIKHTHNTSIS